MIHLIQLRCDAPWSSYLPCFCILGTSVPQSYWRSYFGTLLRNTQEKISSIPCRDKHKLIKSSRTTSNKQNPYFSMCYQEDIYHSLCGHWGKKVYSKCANTAAGKWANGCWEIVTSGSAREDTRCSLCRSGQNSLTAGKLSVFLGAQLDSRSTVAPTQAVDGDQVLPRPTGEIEFLGNRPLR